MTSSRRQRRVAELIQEELGTFLERHVDDPSLEWVTVTAVEVTPDLQLARVYFSVIGDEDRRREAQQGLERASGYLRRELASALQLRLVPELRFFYDDSLDRGRRIDELLEEIRDESEGHAEA
jgi:ribosome-binding factor A